MKKWPWSVPGNPPKNGAVVIATSKQNRDQLREVFDHLDEILTRAEIKLGESNRGKSR